MLLTLAKGACEFVQETLIAQIVELSLMGVRKDCFRRVLRLDYQSVTLKGTPKLMSHFTNDMNVMASGLRLMGGKVIQEPLKAVACIVAGLLRLLAVDAAVAFDRSDPGDHFRPHRLEPATSQPSGDGQHDPRLQDARRDVRRLQGRDGVQRRAAASAAVPSRQQGLLRAFGQNRPHRRAHRADHRNDGLGGRLIWPCLPGCYLVLRGTTDIWGIRLSTGQLGMNDLGTLYVLLAGIIDPARKLSSTYAKLKRASAAVRPHLRFDERKDARRGAGRAEGCCRGMLAVSNSPGFISPTPERARTAWLARPPSTTCRSRSKRARSSPSSARTDPGKSTLVNLLPRLYDPDFGTITIDGVNIRDVRLEDLRNQIGVVTQETLLFDDTIYENILYGKPEAKRAEIEEAARRAYVTRFFDQMPDGFADADRRKRRPALREDSGSGSRWPARSCGTRQS